MVKTAAAMRMITKKGAVMPERRSPSGKAAASGEPGADIAIQRGVTTKDFTALRAYVQRIAPGIIARTYFDSDEESALRQQ